MKKQISIIVMFIAALLLLSFAGPAAAAADGKVNINAATKQELCVLNGVGEKYADRIVKYRENHGDFKTPSEITKVKGIGPKTFEQNKHLIVVEKK